MKRTSKFLSLLLALAMVCSLFVPAMAADEKPAPEPYAIADMKDKLVILHTNDTHGADVTFRTAVDGAEKDRYDSVGTAGVAQMKKDFEAAGAEVILMNAGDSIQGSPLVSISKGKTAIEYMNAAKYDVMTLGNHEMDYGYENLKSLTKIAKFPILGANVINASTKEPVLEANKIITTASGMKVGVFGLATPETLTKADPSKMKGLDFLKAEELYACAQKQVDTLKKAGCEFIVCLSHLGIDEGSVPNRSCDVAGKVTGIDLIVDGHSHSAMKDGKPVKDKTYPSFKNDTKTPIVSNADKLGTVGVVIYDKTAKTMTTELVAADRYVKFDADIQKPIKAEYDRLKKELDVPFADSAVAFNGAKAPGNRTEETNLGDYATDAILWAARKEFGKDKVDAALTNGGGIRVSVAEGKISMWDLKSVFPFGNVLATVEVTGAQLLEALEAGTYCVPDSVGGFPQVSGIEYTINTAVPFDKGELYPASTYYAPKSIGRVTILTVNGKPFDAKANYVIATNDFTANGGDTYCAFKSAKTVKFTSIPMEDALVDYTKTELKNKLTAEQYGKPAGRITVLPEDIKVGSWYEDAAHQMLISGTMKGTGPNVFNPAGTITRGTIYQILFNLEGAPTKDIPASTFTDIEGKWYAPAANWAVASKLLTGTEFKGEEVITRGELATIISKYAAMKGIKVATEGMAMKEAPDYATISAEYLEGMTFCFYGKVMTGDKAGNLNPMGQLTRGELAQAMYNFSKLPVPAAEKAA